MSKRNHSEYNSRRTFLKNTLAAGGAATLGSTALFASGADAIMDGPVHGNVIRIKSNRENYYQPLEQMTIECSGQGTLVVQDAAGTEYFRSDVSGRQRFKAAGVLGYHRVVLMDQKGREKDAAWFPVNCETGIIDASGEFSEMMEMLKYTLMRSSYNRGQLKRMNGKHYIQFSSWFQDHMYAMLGMRYFEKELKSGVDLYTEGQREDGMLHDNYKHPWDPRGSWSRRFDYGNFVKVPEDPTSDSVFVRVPVENIAEFSYMEGVYLTWKATGDDAWMESKLDSMLRAMNYTLTDPYRWSEKFNLTKRGYTIDIWDFQNVYDTKRGGNDTMRVYLDRSEFGILYADNVRFAQSCNYLAEMLEFAGRKDEAVRVREKSGEIKQRIDELSWNGEFYRHWVPEDPTVERDFGGVDESRQVTLSNTWILNRGLLTHAQVTSIIRTYLRIKDEMPGSSPGEWYCCYPPFEKGWSAKKWNYMNGGVTPIAAGELALACFDHGYERYGVDILRRVKQLAEKTGNFLHGCYKGAIEEEPERTFQPIDLRVEANADFSGTGDKPKGVMGWTNEGDNDLHEFPTGKQSFIEVPFDVIDPAENNRAAVLALSAEEGYKTEAAFGIGRKAGSLYFLHCMGGGAIAGTMTWEYEDDTTVTRYISSTSGPGMPKSVENWWTPDIPESRGAMQVLHTAWTGKNDHSPKVGVVIYGMNNPEPDKVIRQLHFRAGEIDSKWMIIGLTLSDAAVYFRPNILSTIPNHWAAAECMYGLIEGLAGIKDDGVAFSAARLSPRWEVAGTDKISVTAKYEASGGYLRYTYSKRGKDRIIEFTGSADRTAVELLLPEGESAKQIEVNGSPVNYTLKQVEGSEYATLKITGKGFHTVVLYC